MVRLYWDASALTKRYVIEAGAQTVDALFSEVPLDHMTATLLTYAETYSVLVRRLNDGRLNPQAFTTAVSSLRSETVYSPAFGILSITPQDIMSGIGLISVHNINASDAAVLAAYLGDLQIAPPGISGILVASDHRFIRAANAEGLNTIDPESVDPADVQAFLSSF